MLDLANVPDVDSQEMLARYVFSKSHISREKRRIKPNAFMPPMNLELSVTRHRDTTEAEIWTIGDDTAAKTNRTLYARGDVLTATYCSQKLQVLAAPELSMNNPNHANVVGWPENDKAAVKLIAMELAAVANFVPAPDS